MAIVFLKDFFYFQAKFFDSLQVLAAGDEEDVHILRILVVGSEQPPVVTPYSPYSGNSNFYFTHINCIGVLKFIFLYI